MLSSTDVPSFATLQHVQTISGTNDGSLALTKHMREMRTLLLNGCENLFIDGATGCGKSRLVPQMLTDFSFSRVCVFTISSVDVTSMQRNTKCASRFCMGNNRAGGATYAKAEVIICTAGLAMRWYADKGLAAFKDYDIFSLTRYMRLKQIQSMLYSSMPFYA